MDTHILMQKASKDNVALFQHAILGYYTMPSRGLLASMAHRPRRRGPACIIELEGGEGGDWDLKAASTFDIICGVLLHYSSPCSLTPTGLCTVDVILHAPHTKCVYVCV